MRENKLKCTRLLRIYTYTHKKEESKVNQTTIFITCIKYIKKKLYIREIG